jgi:hypothetical protein
MHAAAGSAASFLPGDDIACRHVAANEAYVAQPAENGVARKSASAEHAAQLALGMGPWQLRE